jgi:hypothetical protein
MSRLAAHLRANIVAYLALFVALSGTSYAAAVALPPNSVTSRQVKDFSLLKRDFKAGQLPAGARGEAGPAGPTGPAGATKVVVRTGPSVTISPNTFSNANAACNPNETAVGGGGFTSPASEAELNFSYPVAVTGTVPTSWSVGARNVGSSSTRLDPYVVCASP